MATTTSRPVIGKRGPLPDNTGWSAMDKIVRNHDKTVIQDFKEDIDTLLVFAGLFSAVLTAFIIESYKGLSEDPAETSAQILKQISMQLNALMVNINNNGTAIVNPITPPLPDSTFSAPKTSTHVNVLWFASLILSLVAASLGILVKSWLRGYLSMDSTSPRARLRIRFFRYLGLQEWGVFEIAALLPLLIQIALGLFFLGLCFFTFSIHHSVGITSIVIVSIWALLVVMSIFMPFLVARCPYKISSSGTLFSWVRRNLIFRRLNANFPKRSQDSSLEYLPRYRLESHISPFVEEKTISQMSWFDNYVIAGVDRLHADAEYVPPPIIDSFRQTQTRRSSVIPFVLRILDERGLMPSDRWSRLQQPLKSHTTSELWAPLADLIMENLWEEITMYRPDPSQMSMMWTNWMVDGIVLIVSNVHICRPPLWRKIISLCTEEDLQNLLRSLPEDLFDDNREQKIASLWEAEPSIEVPQLLRRLHTLILTVYKNTLQDQKPTLIEMFRDQKPRIYKELGRTIVTTLVARTDVALKNGNPEWIPEVVSIILYLFDHMSDGARRELIQSKWFINPPIAALVLNHMFLVRPRPTSTDSITNIKNMFILSYEFATTKERDDLQPHLLSFIEKAQESHISNLDVTEIIHWLLRTLLNHHQITAFSNPPDFGPCWEQIWSEVTILCARSNGKPWYQKEAAKCIEYMMGTIHRELPDVHDLEWLRSAFPLEFLGALTRLASGPIMAPPNNSDLARFTQVYR